MQNLSSTVLIAFGGALVVFGGYHVLVVAPALRRMRRALETQDELLGGTAGKASDRVAQLESAAAQSAAYDRALEPRVIALESALASVPHLGFVRYNAFDDTSSDLSYALALLSKSGDGVVISSIWSREETRTYGKAVAGFTTAQDASNEERAAIAQARASFA